MRALLGRILCAIGLHRWKMTGYGWAGPRRGFTYLLECQRNSCDGSKYE